MYHLKSNDLEVQTANYTNKVTKNDLHDAIFLVWSERKKYRLPQWKRRLLNMFNSSVFIVKTTSKF